ncbi:hypothetical protein [Shewanella litorisediminis]|uniref:Uncharacterized protein n=1 Tax=Shewanella litorisediminis TaxID=1173586 RepID=A0ABX7G504_9GAMM|nr:hypothetical protein [Shewanella litorisediminis]MCL2917879.1 hypothetical protein [Shewanella litorisediminis]QRH02315.1 hypothetical protein JQC75_02500 [Shewanella litorisediminis]
MYNTAKKQVWWGVLKTARGTSIVIHDNQLPEASAGRVYLYNTERKAIIEYVEDIVKPNLHELDEAGLKAAESNFSGEWKAARASFMEKHHARINLSNIKDAPASSRKAKADAEPEYEDLSAGGSSSSDDFGDDWADDFDD